MKPTGNFTTYAGKSLTQTGLIICRVSGADVYVCDSLVILKMTPVEYAAAVQPATQCAPGNWLCTNGKRRPLLGFELPIDRWFEQHAASVLTSSTPTRCERCPLTFAEKSVSVQGYYNTFTGSISFYDRRLLASFGTGVNLYTAGSGCPAVMLAGEKPVGIVSAARENPANVFAVKMYFAQKAAEDAARAAAKAEREAEKAAKEAEKKAKDAEKKAKAKKTA